MAKARVRAARIGIGWRWTSACIMIATALQSPAAQSQTGDHRNAAASKLDRAADLLRAQGYQASGDKIMGSIVAGQRKRFTIELVSGAPNLVVVACSGECGKLEILVFDDERKLLTNTIGKQDLIVVNANPSASGPHDVELGVPDCRAQQCQVGLLVLRRGSSPQAAGDAEYRRYENRDLDGGDIARFKDVGAVQACESRCTENAQCRAYSFDKWNRYCFLKSRIGVLRLDPRSTTGVRADIPAPPLARGEIKMERHRGRAFPGSGLQDRQR